MASGNETGGRFDGRENAAGAPLLLDLHTHSTASDGTLSPSELVSHALGAGISILALTDHDTMNGVEEFQNAARARGIHGVGGIEFSTDYEKGILHILGYCLDSDNGELADAIEYFHGSRDDRAPKIIDRLCGEGIPLSLDEVKQEAAGGQIGRPHFALALVRKGVCKDCQEAFDRFLGKNKPAYVPRERITIERAITLIRGAGGFSSLSHPILTNAGTGSRLFSLVKSLRETGLDGIEVFSPTHGEEVTLSLLRIAAELGLLITGGSDFHGKVKPDYAMGIDARASGIVLSSLGSRIDIQGTAP
jgi:hypothetical protein